jgi:serine/threonine-protein kinase
MTVMRACRAAAHRQGTGRRDVKTSNVLLTREGSAKVADVGLATMTDYFSSATACPGTFMYAAPEVLMGKPSNTKVQITARACACHAALTFVLSNVNHLRL